jgi:hypothetical protein
VAIGRGRDVLVVTDADRASRVPGIVAAAEHAVRRVAAMWSGPWSHHVVVYAVRSQRAFASTFRPGLPPNDATAVEVPLPVWIPQWDNWPQPRRGPGPVRIIIDPRELRFADDPDLLAHETTHVATAEFMRFAPIWLGEGYAQHVADTDWPGHLRTVARRLLRGSGRVLRLPDDGSFYGGEVAANYDIGELACGFVAHRWGEARLQRLIRSYRARAAGDTPGGVLHSALGVPVPEFDRMLTAYAQHLVG